MFHHLGGDSLNSILKLQINSFRLFTELAVTPCASTVNWEGSHEFKTRISVQSERAIDSITVALYLGTYNINK